MKSVHVSLLRGTSTVFQRCPPICSVHNHRVQVLSDKEDRRHQPSLPGPRGTLFHHARSPLHANMMFSRAFSLKPLETAAGMLPMVTCPPVAALMGGLVLGEAVVGKLWLTGRVLGISGVFKGLMSGDFAAWRFAFLGGMLGGALIAYQLIPGMITTLPDTFSVGRAAASGLLVGIGSSMGNGCTSGHGVCGNARMSPRSFVYTLTFMFTGALTASLTASHAALQIPTISHSEAIRTAVTITPCSQMLFLVSAAMFAVLLALKNQKSLTKPLMLASEMVSGAVFAVGLALSGMTQPDKVIAFLSVLHPGWNLSLMFVMGGAVFISLIGYQSVIRGKLFNTPVYSPSYSLPTSNSIDTRLLIGGAIFGAGWGLSGYCPGPAIVGLVQPSVHLLAYFATFFAGMYIDKTILANVGVKKQQA